MNSKARRRTTGLPAQLIALLRKHCRSGRQARSGAPALHGEGWVFAVPTGGPLNPNTDYHEWKDLL